MSATVLILSGSPSESSRSALLADYVLAQLSRRGVEAHHIRLRSLDAHALLTADTSHPSYQAFEAQVSDAHGLVLSTPIYKAAYTGLMKAALDLLPQFALAGKVAMPLATGGSPAHVLALDYSLRPVLQSMGVRHVVQSQFVADSDLNRETGQLTAEVVAPLDCALENFMHSLSDSDNVRWLGHPRPPGPELRL